MRINKKLIFAVIALLSAGCGGLRYDLQPVVRKVTPVAESADLPLGLAAPATMLAALPARNSSEALLLRMGNEFELSGKATGQGSDALFEPQWSGHGSPFADVAYAVYRFNVEGYLGQQTIKLTWTDPPPDYSSLWLGLSRYNTFGVGYWEWRHCRTNDFIDFGPEGFQPYINKNSNDILLTVILLGTDTASLGQIELGGTLLDDWCMSGHDAQHSSFSPHVGPRTNHLGWVLDLGGEVRANPVMAADGTIYVGTYQVGGDPSQFYAINPDGTIKWSFDAPASIVNAASVAPDGSIYMSCGSSPLKGKLFAFAPDGTVKWTFGSGMVRSPLIGPNGSVYVAINSEQGSMNALNPEDGSVKWTLEFTSNLLIPALSSNETIYIACEDGNLYAINSNGSLLWNIAIDNPSTCTISPEGIVYTSSNNGYLFAVSPDGVIQWTYNLNSYPSQAAIGPDGIAYIGDGTSFMGNTINGLHAVDQNGINKWDFSLTGWTMRDQPAIGADGTIYVTGFTFGILNSALLAIKPDGTLLWVYGSQELMYPPAIGNDGTLYVGSANHSLYAFGP